MGLHTILLSEDHEGGAHVRNLRTSRGASTTGLHACLNWHGLPVIMGHKYAGDEHLYSIALTLKSVPTYVTMLARTALAVLLVLWVAYSFLWLSVPSFPTRFTASGDRLNIIKWLPRLARRFSKLAWTKRHVGAPLAGPPNPRQPGLLSSLHRVQQCFKSAVPAWLCCWWVNCYGHSPLYLLTQMGNGVNVSLQASTHA